MPNPTAPLHQAPRASGPAFRAVLFDFDGTLTRPDALDFSAVRRAIGCPPAMAILEYIDALPAEEERARSRRILDDWELAAAKKSVPNDGAEQLIVLLKRAGTALGIITRNQLSSIHESLKNFPSLREGDFSVILTRESPGRPKPHPDGVLEAARLFGVPPRDMLVVGDFLFDIAAGKAAGAATALITNGQTSKKPSDTVAAAAGIPAELSRPDYTIAALDELKEIIGL